jgi:uncharacterized protein
MGSNDPLGHVTTVSGWQMTANLELEKDATSSFRIGAMVKVPVNGTQAIGAISSIQSELSPPRRVIVADLLGELITEGDAVRFIRGVSNYPIPGSPVHRASDRDLKAIYDRPPVPSIRVGSLYNDPGTPAYVLIDELLTKHFAVLGTAGTGKSSGVVLILSAILAGHPNAHVVLLDPHNEYSTALGDLADVITVDNLQLPLWLLDLEEAERALVRGGTSFEQDSQVMILKDAIAWARRHFDEKFPSSSVTVDTPTPYRTFELLRFINEEMGRLGKPDTSAPYLRLRTRVESLREDRRFNFMFPAGDRDTLSQIVQRLLRIPVKGKPLTIVDLSGVPSEIVDVVVSMICRIIFDFSLWSDRTKRPPLLLVCEEAHRYVPSNQRVGFDSTRKEITRIAKEGRKYGISLALVTQRPAEISLEALSQCGTVFAMRLGADADQNFIARAVPDAARGMLTALPSLPQREAIVSGDGVRLAMRIRFDDLPPEHQPRSESARFSEAWQKDEVDEAFVEDGIRRWRSQRRS